MGIAMISLCNHFVSDQSSHKRTLVDRESECLDLYSENPAKRLCASRSNPHSYYKKKDEGLKKRHSKRYVEAKSEATPRQLARRSLASRFVFQMLQQTYNLATTSRGLVMSFKRIISGKEQVLDQAYVDGPLLAIAFTYLRRAGLVRPSLGLINVFP